MATTRTTDPDADRIAAHDEIRTQQRDVWNRFAGGWERWDPVIRDAMADVGDALIRSLQICEDQRHLDVAAGTGEPGLTIASLAPRGHVTLTDLAPSMLDAAARRATALGIDNVHLRACSADDLPFAEAAFDSASCRFGFMLFPDLDAAASELARVVRPGGRVAVAVWAEPDRNPWATITGDAIATEVAVEPPPPGAPGLFRCAPAGLLTGVLERTSFVDVVEWDVPVVVTLERPEDFWQLVVDCTAPVTAVLASVEPEQRERIAAKVIATARSFVSGGLVRLPGTARCVAATRAPAADW